MRYARALFVCAWLCIIDRAAQLQDAVFGDFRARFRCWSCSPPTYIVEYKQIHVAGIWSHAVVLCQEAPVSSDIQTGEGGEGLGDK